MLGPVSQDNLPPYNLLSLEICINLSLAETIVQNLYVQCKTALTFLLFSSEEVGSVAAVLCGLPKQRLVCEPLFWQTT